MADRLVLATHNRDKGAELRSILSDSRIEVLTLEAFPEIGEVVEDGATLEENAAKKARTVFEATGLPSLADDSGLEVYYLNGAPGLYSSRYSGPGATYESNRRKLLTAMLGVPARRRRARFRSVLSLIGPGVNETVEGICYGMITEEPRGTNGFGYDPVFRPDGSDTTFAEMSPAEKNRISHRSAALQKIRPVLVEYFEV